jgi:hypothetical protein
MVSPQIKIEQLNNPLNVKIFNQSAASNAIDATPPYCKGEKKYKRRKL